MRAPVLAVLLAAPAASLYLAAAPQDIASSPPATPFQVVVMLMTAPGQFEWRDMVRRHWPTTASNVTALGREVEMVMRFAVGRAPGLPGQVGCQVESSQHGDMALLDVEDGVREFHSRAQHNGKIWHVFKWALTHFPKAELYFKQDDDNIVNWRVALPTMLKHASQPVEDLPLKRRYVGRVQMEAPGKPCGMGELYGFSRDIVTFATTFFKPEERTEDVATCEWAYGAELFLGPVDKGGLLSWPAYENAWIHPVKEPEVYESCFKETSCKVKYLWGDEQDITFRLLPSVESAELWLLHNSTAKQEENY